MLPVNVSEFLKGNSNTYVLYLKHNKSLNVLLLALPTSAFKKHFVCLTHQRFLYFHKSSKGRVDRGLNFKPLFSRFVPFTALTINETLVAL